MEVTEQPNEDEAPLLGENSARCPDNGAASSSYTDFTVILYFMAIHFLLAFCEMVLVAPLIKLFEESLCVTHFGFPSGGVEERLCKIPEIQRPLATIRGWKSMFDTVPVLLVAIPVGRLGDAYGRRKVLGFTLIGVAAWLCGVFVVCAFPRTFPLRLIWLCSIFLFCGGGLNAAASYMWAMSAGAIPSAGRSHAFYYIFSAFYVAELLGSFIASVTIDITPWIACALAMISILLCLILLFVMPTFQSSASFSNPPILEEEVRSVNKEPKGSIKILIRTLSKRNTCLIIPAFMVGIFRYTTLNILIQYASIQFGIKLSESARFYSWTAMVNIALFLLIVPNTSNYIRKQNRIRPQTIDLFLVRSALCVLCLGCVGIGFARSTTAVSVAVLMFACGFGSRVSALSLVSYWVPDDVKTTVYASITVLESLGHMIGDPSMHQILAASLQLPYFWHALPFFVAAIFYGLAGLSTSFIRIDRATRDSKSDIIDSPQGDEMS